MDVHRHGEPGYFSIAELPQRGSVEDQAFGSDWWELDQLLKFYLSQFVVVTGIAGHGKSTFLLNVLCRLAKIHGIHSFLYVPENEPYLREKLRKIWNDDASFDYFAREQMFVQSAIYDYSDNPCKTLDWVLGKAIHGIEHHKVELVLIDPWNELERAKPRDMLMTDYIGQCLQMVKDFCRSCNVIVAMVAHPTKAVNEAGGRVPNLSDIEGSMNWFNKCDNGIVVHRDFDKPNTTRVISSKVREIGAGKNGTCYFFVDPITGIFTPQYGAVIEKS
jgi:twinkle protein